MCDVVGLHRCMSRSGFDFLHNSTIFMSFFVDFPNAKSQLISISIVKCQTIQAILRPESIYASLDSVVCTAASKQRVLFCLSSSPPQIPTRIFSSLLETFSTPHIQQPWQMTRTCAMSCQTCSNAPTSWPMR